MDSNVSVANFFLHSLLGPSHWNSQLLRLILPHKLKHLISCGHM